LSNNSNPLSASTPWDVVAVGYAETTSQTLMQYAEVAVAESNLKPGATILDVACGPGALALKLAVKASRVHAIDFSESMLEVFRSNLKRSGTKNIDIQHGDAQLLPYADAMFDATFSMFGLMFFPERHKGFAEIYRTLKSGGTIAVTSWAPVDDSPAMQLRFGALRVMKPELPEQQRSIATLENPDVFRKEMLDAGFRKVKINRVTKAFPVQSIPEFWDTMVKGSAPIQMLKKNMGETVWLGKEKLALEYLQTRLQKIPTSLTSDAWLGTAIK